MVISCVHCNGVQPSGWVAGDVCVHCGKAVRRDVRCAWCTAWVPEGGFCRSCGSAIVPREHYGAARMLKEGGVDRFTLPKMLTEMDPAQLDNLERIYQRHAAIAARLVDDAAFLERYLFHKIWSASLDDKLAEQIPWPKHEVEAFGRPTPAPDAALDRARQIAETSRIPMLRSLAAIVRLKLDDWTMMSQVSGLFHNGQGEIREEAALALTSWRIRFGVEEAPTRASREPQLVEELRKSPFRTAAAVRLKLMGDDIELPMEAIGSQDSDISVAAAMATSDVPALRLLLKTSDAHQLRAVSLELIYLKELSSLAGVLKNADDELLYALLDDMMRRKNSGAIELREVLLPILEKHKNERMRDRAGLMLCRACHSDDALRIARASLKLPRVLQALMQEAKLDTDRMEELVTYLVEEKQFTTSQYGVNDLAEKQLVRDTLVPRLFNKADEATQKELCKFGELQLMQRGDAELHSFLAKVAYGHKSSKVRETAWWCLRRWYLRQDRRDRSLVMLSAEPATTLFGSVAAFMRMLTMILGDSPESMESSIREDLEGVLKHAQSAALKTDERAAWALADAVVNMMHNKDADFTLRTSGASFLAAMAGVPAWRAKVLPMFQQFQSTDLKYACDQAKERIGR